jgi:hypothetical protein
VKKKVEPVAVFLADAALVGTGLIHLYLVALMARARLGADRPGGAA